MSEADPGVVIVGASAAGLAAADRLRELGFDRRIVVVGDEPHLPYQRPPLSKGMLAGSLPREALAAPPPHPDVELMLGVRATALHRERRFVELDSGDHLPYESVIIATGSRPRRLAGPGTAERTLQTVDDCTFLRARLQDRPSLLVIGAGFLGMEIASTCLPFATGVTIVDVRAPLQGQLGSYLSTMLVAAARESGVDIHVRPDGIEPLIADGCLAGVRFPDGRSLTADLVVTAVGSVPNTEWLAGTGLPIGDGIEVDAHCRAAPGVYAVGDVASSVDPWSSRRRRSPQWTSAREQGRIAAESIVGQPSATARSVPYFWTDQFGYSLKVSGRLPADGEPELVDGDRAGGSCVLHWPAADGPGTAVAVNHRITVGRLASVARSGSLTAPAGHR